MKYSWYMIVLRYDWCHISWMHAHSKQLFLYLLLMRYSAVACFTPDATTDRLNLKAKGVFYMSPSVRTATHYEWITLSNIKQLSRIKMGFFLVYFFFGTTHWATLMISSKQSLQRYRKENKVTKVSKEFWGKSWAPSSVNPSLGQQPSSLLQTDQTLFPINPQTVIMMK